MRDTVQISGSWGEITAHAATGHVVEYDDGGTLPDPDGATGYADIGMIDPASIAHNGGGGDVLAFGYWTKAGDYAEPLTMTLTPDERGEMFFHDWEPLRLLPAPAGEGR
jgi:hypothetical protein